MRTTHSPKWWYYILIPIASAALTIALAEICFEVFFPIPFSIESNMYFEPDQYTGYRLKANSTGYFQHQIPARTNKNGHRDNSVSIEKPEGVFRILLLGDSFTVGANVARDASYATILEALLNNHNTAVSVEVINAGVGGWEPFQYAQYYEHYGRDFSPDLILIGFFVGNDTYNQARDVHHTRTAILGRRVSRKAASDPFIHFKVFFYNYSNIARIILNKGPKKMDFTRKNCADFSNQFIKIQHQRINNHLKWTTHLQERAENAVFQIRRIKKMAERDSIPLVTLLFPDENQINANLQDILLTDKERSQYDFEMPQSMLLEMFRNVAIPVIDLLPFFKKDSRCLYMNDTHWTPEGHELAAEAILIKITNGNIINLTNASSRGRTAPLSSDQSEMP